VDVGDVEQLEHLVLLSGRITALRRPIVRRRAKYRRIAG